MTQKVLLETTTCIDRLFGSQKVKEKINLFLEGKELYISDFIKGEIKNNILTESCELYNLLLENTISESMLLFDENGQSHQKDNRFKKILAYLLLDNDNETASKMKQLIELRLSNLIKYFDETIFEGMRNVGETKCKRAGFKAEEDKTTGKYEIKDSCTQDKVQNCNIINFFSMHCLSMKKVSKIKSGAIKKYKEGVKKVLIIHEQSQKLNSSRIQKRLKGQNCWSIGDVIIALDTPKTHVLYTTDKKHLYPICKGLKRNFYIEKY